jgi:hypothetical protein
LIPKNRQARPEKERQKKHSRKANFGESSTILFFPDLARQLLLGIHPSPQMQHDKSTSQKLNAIIIALAPLPTFSRSIKDQ